MTAALIDRRRPHLFAAALCSGLAGANLVRGASPAVALVAAVLLPLAAWGDGVTRLALVALALALVLMRVT